VNGEVGDSIGGLPAAPAACFRWRTNLRTLMEWNVGNFNRQNF
jgi:hypothetical protein